MPAEIAGQRQQRGDLGDLRRLKVHGPQFEPAAGVGDRPAEKEQVEKQHQRAGVEQVTEGGQGVVVDGQRQAHREQPHRKVNHLLGGQGGQGAAQSGRVDHSQPGGAQREHREGKQPVEIMDAPPLEQSGYPPSHAPVFRRI
jgi:hypothetical protein